MIYIKKNNYDVSNQNITKKENKISGKNVKIFVENKIGGKNAKILVENKIGGKNIPIF